MKQAERPGLFPPRVGWIPILIALAVVAVASVVAFVPEYATHQVIGVTNTDKHQADVVADQTPGAGTTMDSGHLVYSPGAGPSGGPVVNTKAGPGAGCSQRRNAGATDIGVTGSQIHITTTDVTTGVGAGFLGQAVQGMKAALNQVNAAGGVCGRRIVFHPSPINDGWDGPTGANYISGFINSSDGVFALVGEPDSEGLYSAQHSGLIDQAGIPVVGTDGMLSSQYTDPWIWPVAASTITNMHIAAQYACKQLHAHNVGIVYDSKYKFGPEGANAFKAQIQRSCGSTLSMGSDCSTAFCGVSPDATSYTSQITAFNGACAGSSGSPKCDVVVMLLEPGPMEVWMRGEENCGCSWYRTLMGGEPLFDDSLAGNCGQGCARMMVWTGYKPYLQPFDGEAPVYTYAHALAQVCPSCDLHNEFTEGAYLGTELFIAACQQVGSNLTRAALRQVLDSQTFDLGLSQPLHYGTGLPHLANTSMAAYSDNASGTFNGWSYANTGFISDPAPGKDFD